MSTTSQGASDTSALTQPIELGSSTIIQLLDARTTSTKEVLDYLEQECDAILECRLCQSMFRSLANFIAHKRIYCLRSFKDEQVKRKYYVNPSMPVVEPVDADSVKIPRRSTAGGRRNWRGRKARPVRKTAPADLSKIKERPAVEVEIKPIEGVSCALSQTVAGSEVDGRSSAAASNSDKSEVITTVEPKDGYPNMNLRQRSGKSTLALGLVEWEDVEDDDAKALQKCKSLTSKVALAEVLSKRTDCDFTKMKCLTCNATFATAKNLNFHMLNKHGKKRNLYPCIYCKNVFTQFWGVTRHLKNAHNLSGDSVDKAREMIRSRVYSESLNSSADKLEQEQATTTAATTTSVAATAATAATTSAIAAATTSAAAATTSTVPTTSPQPKPMANNLPSRTAKASLRCTLCTKPFGKRQYLNLHMAACYKKAGLQPPPSKKSETVDEKPAKPLLFVCKTCNRAFSLRQNMVMHAVACGKRRKDIGSSTDAKQDSSKSEGSSSEVVASDVQEQSNIDLFSESPKESSTSSNDTSNESPDSSIPKKVSPTKFDSDDILSQLSPSDEAKEEERNLTPPVTPTSLALSRPKRNLKPKQFSDGTVSVRRKVPEVVRVQQADGSQVYKLRQDVEVVTPPVAPPPLVQVVQQETEIKTEAKVTPLETMVEEAVDIVKAKDTKGMRIFIQGESVPLLDDDDEAKIAGMVDMSKLLCLKCKRQYGSSSNLRRHAVRHLGWRRYKCKLCKFTSYNKSECKSHLRKCHGHEVATLLDGGLSPYIIDLGALLDESEDGNGKLNISVPTTSENGRTTPTSCRTRARSKEPVVIEGQATAEDLPKAGGRRKSGRAKKQTADTSSDEKTTPTMSDSSSKSLSSSASSDKDADVAGGRPRARSRKQELHILSDGVVATSQDENNKRSHTAVSSGGGVENGPSEPSQPKLLKVVDISERRETVKRRESSAKLEGLVNKLKSIRKPLVGAVEDNGKAAQVEASIVVPATVAAEGYPDVISAVSPPLNIPTTVSEVIKGDN